MADNSKLPPMTRKSTPLSWDERLKRATTKKTKPGAVDDNAVKRALKQRRKLKEAYGN